ncbi:MAG: S9 family peptidase [Phycisphaerae bacterium]|nr:S9 family peptidase [Phycisphaerae bacterium]
MRVWSIIGLSVVLASGAAAIGQAPAGGRAQAAGRPSLEQFFRIRAPGTPVMLPDGSLLMRDWPNGVWQMYRVLPASHAKGQAPNYKPGEATVVRLTDLTDGVAGFSVSPDGGKAILMHSAGGNENTQLTLIEIKPGDATTPALVPVLRAERVQAAVNCWLPDSSGFVYSANLDSPSDFHLYRHDFASGKATRLLAKAGSWSAADVSRDGARVLVEQYRSASDSECFELDVKTGALRDLTIRPKGGGTAASHLVGYAPGEESVIATSDAETGRNALFVIDLKTGAWRQPVPALAAHDLEVATLSGDGSLLAVSSNEEGYGVPHVYDVATWTSLGFPETAKGVIGGTDFRGETLLWSTGRSLSWSNSNARDCGAAWVTTYPVAGAQAGAGGAVTVQVTFPDTQGIDLARFPLPELVKYRAFDGVEIPAFVFTPPGYVKGTPIPFVVMYHGGPEGQHRPIFSVTQQYLLSEGFGVMAPNVRGSSGYGREFLMMDDYAKRWDSVRDGVDAAEWLVANGLSAPGKIATLGGSYGGFMSVACLVEDQERVDAGKRKERLFGAGVNLVGIVNFKTFLEKTAGYRRKLREAEYGPLSDEKFLLSVSPVTRIEKVKAPMFIGHGFNDPRVPVEEAMQLSVALKDRGVPVQLFVAPDEGHGFQKLQNRVYFYERVSVFLRQTIGK